MAVKRNISGILLLDKPYGMSSNFALTKVKRLFHPKKAGHTGSLDPLATGMLPICFGHATKYSQYLLDAKKAYLVTGRLGIQTDTGDVEGVPIKETPQFSVTQERLLEVLASFTGNISQVPPMYSALKKEGKPLYQYARAGIEVERAARRVTIFELALKSFNGQDFTVRVKSSKGTYMRTLIEDIGNALDNIGAHVIKLHRCYSEPFDALPMVSLEMLEACEDRDKYCLPIDTAVSFLPATTLPTDAIKKLLNGLHLPLTEKSGIIGKNIELIRIYSESKKFAGLAKVENDKLAPHKLLPL